MSSESELFKLNDAVRITELGKPSEVCRVTKVGTPDSPLIIEVAPFRTRKTAQWKLRNKYSGK